MSIFSDFAKKAGSFVSGLTSVAKAIPVVGGTLGAITGTAGAVLTKLGGGGSARPVVAVPAPTQFPTGGDMSTQMPSLPPLSGDWINMTGARSGANTNLMGFQVPGLDQLLNAGKAMFTGGAQGAQAAVQNIAPSTGTTGGIPTRYGTLQGKKAPTVTTRRFSKCDRGYALAMDGYCYPRAMLPRWARKWKPEYRPVVSRADQKAIRRADGARKRLVKLTKASGAFASMHKPHHDKPARRRRS